MGDAIMAEEGFERKPNADHQQFLLKDWEAAHRSRENYAAMRVAILGVCLTMLGLVVTLGRGTQYPGIIGIWCILLLTVFAGVRMLAIVNRAVYIFFWYMATLEEEFREVGFASIWKQYVLKRARDAAGTAFAVAFHLVNWAVVLLITVSAIVGVRLDNSLCNPWFDKILIFVSAVIFAIWNSYHVARQFDLRRFIPRIENDLLETRRVLVATRKQEKPNHRLSDGEAVRSNR
jgi:hypothetical protein